MGIGRSYFMEQKNRKTMTISDMLNECQAFMIVNCQFGHIGPERTTSKN